MKKFRKVILAATAIAVVSAAAPAVAGTKYDEAATCLQAVSITYNGKVYNLMPYNVATGQGHFKPYTGNDPNVVLAGGISLRAGLIDTGSPWAVKKSEIEACLNKIPNLKFLNRTDN